VNKSDLPRVEDAQGPPREQLLDELCIKLNLMGWFETSAQSGANIGLAVREVLLVSAMQALSLSGAVAAAAAGSPLPLPTRSWADTAEGLDLNSSAKLAPTDGAAAAAAATAAAAIAAAAAATD
ncbi:unnamed protein product, partial [Phaeothamnion confervicola]